MHDQFSYIINHSLAGNIEQDLVSILLVFTSLPTPQKW